MNDEHAASPSSSRRHLLARGATAGLAGAAVLTGGRPVSATAPDDSAPESSTPSGSAPGNPAPDGTAPDDSAPATTAVDLGAPTGADADAVLRMLGIELATRDLYQAASAAGAAAGNPDVMTVIADSHDAYAESFAALIGVSASGSIDQAFYDERLADFESDDVAAVADAAYVLESQLVATYIDLIAEVKHVDAATEMAAILVVEARHGTLLADVAGRGNDLVALLDNEEVALR